MIEGKMAGTAMKIRWVLRHNPQNRLLPPKYYATPVFAGRRDAGEMIRQIVGRSVLSAGDIVDAFANAGEVAANWLAAGCSVELPEIGSLLLEFSTRMGHDRHRQTFIGSNYIFNPF